MKKRILFSVCAVAALAVLGVAGNAQAGLLFLGSDPAQGSFDPPENAYGQLFVPEGTLVELTPTGGGSTVWASITSGGGAGVPSNTALASFDKALGVDDLDLSKEVDGENDFKVDNDEYVQFEFYSDAAGTVPTTLLIDIGLRDFTGADFATATTFGTDGSSELDGPHPFDDGTGSSTGSGVTYQKTGGPTTDYVTFSQAAHIYRIKNDSAGTRGLKLAYFDPGDYQIIPEPTSLTLFGLAMFASCTMRRRMI